MKRLKRTTMMQLLLQYKSTCVFYRTQAQQASPNFLFFKCTLDVSCITRLPNPGGSKGTYKIVGKIIIKMTSAIKCLFFCLQLLIFYMSLYCWNFLFSAWDFAWNLAQFRENLITINISRSGPALQGFFVIKKN